MRLVLPALLFSFLTMLTPARADTCQGPIARAPDGTPITRAALNSGEVRITYIGHATFTIESPRGVIAATDYNDYIRPLDPPTIATMNHAHSTHFTHTPDPAIRHVLRGWIGPSGALPRHDLREEDMRVRNVPTNIRAGWNDAGGGGTEFSGNSIFIFEVAGLCIAHLGHLHHVLAPEHLTAIGQVDVVLAPVDGSWTLDPSGMDEVLTQLKPKLVIPMHFISNRVLEGFLSRAASKFEIARAGSAEVVLSIPTLPAKPTVLVLEGR